MEGWTWWDLGLWGAFGYCAVAILVRLMLARRDALIEQVRVQLKNEQKRQAGTKTKSAGANASGSRDAGKEAAA